jgi:hypothetical protein
MSKYLTVLAILFVLASCSSNETKDKNKSGEDSTSITYIDGNVALTSLSEKHVKGIKVHSFVADTAINPTEDVIRTSFTITITEALLHQIKKQGFDAILLDIKANGQSGKPYSYIGTYLPALSGMVIYPDKHIVFSHQAIRNLQIDIPFRKLELPAGAQYVNLSLIAFPVSFVQDTNRIETRYIERIGSNPLFEQQYTAQLIAPALTLNQITIADYKINTQNKAASSYDFALGGSGYPDPYLQVWCGKELLYYSPTTKNSLTVKIPYTSTAFYTSAKDVLTIHFLDYDKGPFNTDDKIENITGTCAEIKALKKFKGTVITTGNITIKQP